MKAVFSLPEKPIPCKQARISVLCPQSHYVRDPHQLAPLVSFLHLTIDQARRHLPLASLPSFATHLEPLSKMSRQRIKVKIQAITGEERQTVGSQELSQGVDE